MYHRQVSISTNNLISSQVQIHLDFRETKNRFYNINISFHNLENLCHQFEKQSFEAYPPLLAESTALLAYHIQYF